VGRSQIAKELFDLLTDRKHETLSAGTIVRDKGGNDLNGQLLKDLPAAQNVILALNEYGIDASNNKRQRLDPEMLRGADRIIVMAEKDNIPDYLVNDSRMIYWDVRDPKDTDLDNHKKIMHEIYNLLEDFIKTL